MRQPIPRAFSVVFVIVVAAVASGCQAITDLQATLFGWQQPQAAVTPPPSPPPASPLVADRVVVLKSRRILELQRGGKTLETFPIALGPHSVATKRQAGDGRTPEGVYRIDGRSMNTRWSRELHISYPDARDRAQAEAKHVDPGGAIFIHGMPRDYGPYDPPFWIRDWTEGCIAVGNAAIVKIWDAVPDETPIEIRP
jgi:murein L,D-transpeptidase YafK